MVKIQLALKQATKTQRGSRGFFNLGARWWSTPRFGHFTSGKDPVLLVQVAGWT
jgi:hypothetical protein